MGEDYRNLSKHASWREAIIPGFKKPLQKTSVFHVFAKIKTHSLMIYLHSVKIFSKAKIT